MNPVQRGKLAIAAAAIGVGLLSVTGCGFVNAQQTTHQYSASDGIKADLGPLQLRNILIVSSGEKEPGRVIGAVFNQSGNDVTLTVSGANGAQTEIPVKANSETYLNDTADAAILSTAGVVPGGLTPVTIRSGSDSATINVPVVDGTLPEYAKYLPSTPTPTATPTSTSTATTSEAPAAGH
ncbi:hypothetical protein [Arthrobacter sp. ISL-95]|uniref:hypothetical protein n=1 Tax=Arthrobacter sp. ISL-95 TaxID=2819116 RepID=UPI001BE82DF9|nr:hypothetical protein [Arthrobacter sp. ISL-95]MBT2584709.1 hypothetical protein [Arthrobacter sp. ISL-95]